MSPDGAKRPRDRSRRLPTRTDAELAQAALEAEEIPSVIASDDAGGAYPFDLGGGPRLLVAEADADRAREILAPEHEE